MGCILPPTTHRKICGGPTGQDFPPPSLLPTPDPGTGKAAGSPLPPRGLGAQLLNCMPEDKKCLEVLLQDGSLAAEDAVLLQSPTATQKRLISLHFLGSKSKSALRSRPSRTEAGLVGEQREKAHQDVCNLSQGTSSLPASSRSSVWLLHPVWFLNVCFPVTTDGLWV